MTADRMHPVTINSTHAALALIVLSCMRGASADDSPTSAAASLQSSEFFENRVRPVLVEKCLSCHGPAQAERGLRLDAAEHLRTGGEGGPVLVPGDPDASLLIQAVRRTRDDLQMPPDDPLPAEAVADLTRWIAEGAVWPDNVALDSHADAGWETHWAFQPPANPYPPDDPQHWSENPVDRFISAQHVVRGLKPVEPADRATLIRRVYFDLLGLPPTPEQLHRALADDSPDAFARLVEELLASQAYGEHWGRHWMDIVRYADTAGDNADYPVPEARLYRDYIIRSYNIDKPVDRFITEQLAGDILARDAPPDQYAELVTATGFLALSRRYATAPYELWNLTLEDTIDTVGQAFLGLSLKCARCHDHKFDPVSSNDYYALYGIFDSTQYPWAGGEEFSSKKIHRQHFVSLLPEEQTAPVQAEFAQQLATLAGQIAATEQQLEAAVEEAKPDLKKSLDSLRSAEFNLQRRGAPPALPVAYAVRDREPHDVARQLKGDIAQPGQVVPRGAISFFGGQLSIPQGQSGRLQLAEWLVSPKHPLTARVYVNRVWQQHFGRGLVDTPSNFGMRGSTPSHPELLDFLARHLIASQWSTKDLHRLILTSRTWQLSSLGDAANEAADPGNIGLWRHTRRRLEAEEIRDAMLASGGGLDTNPPGLHAFPAAHEWKWTQHNPFRDFYDSPHRSVYLMTSRLQRHPFLGLFDGPDTNTSTAVRTVSTVPPQALYLMNSPEMQGIAASLAKRLVQSSADHDARIRLAHRLCYSRDATDAECARAAEYLSAGTSALMQSSVPENERELTAWTSYARLLLASNEFFYID
ncbi:MAG: PSD1 domain-containing protein [Planctomycetaceae bacterium]|nr:PSD1 domain-containing protein [Planctomycetaceae bacterium]